MDNQRNTPINRQRSSTGTRPDTTGQPNSRSPQSESMRTFSRQSNPVNPSTRPTDRKRAYGDRVAIDPRTAAERSQPAQRPQSRSAVRPDLYQSVEIPDFVPVTDRRPLSANPKTMARQEEAMRPIRTVERGNTFERSTPTRSAQPSQGNNGRSGNGGGMPPSRGNSSFQNSNENGGDSGGRPMKKGNGNGNGTPPPKKPKKKKKAWQLVLTWLFVIMLSVGLIGGIGGFVYVQSVIAQTEDIDPAKIQDGLHENSVILDANGKVLETLQNEGVRKIVKYSDMSPNLINAYISVEDKTFWDHNGFNVVRLVGSVWQSFTKGDRIKGTSTITQQLARNIYLVETKSVRKP